MFEIATPWVFILLPIPLFLWKTLSPYAIPIQSALRVPFFQHLTLQPPETRNTYSYGFMIGWMALVIALSGPQWVGPPERTKQEGRPIMLALDVSGSMAIEDMIIQQRPLSRFNVVRYAAKEFVKQRTGDKIGLILFGSRAYLQTPLTYDHITIQEQLNDASVGLAGQATAIGDAIALSVKHLNTKKVHQGILILLTDGVNNAGLLSPQNATQMAKQKNIKIYTIGLSQNQNTLFQLMTPNSELDENTLKTIAKETHGQYFRATNPESLMRIYQLIDELEYKTKDEIMRQPKKEYYPWPLSIALFCCIFAMFTQYRIKRC